MDNYILFVRDLLFSETKIHYTMDDMKALESLLHSSPQLGQRIKRHWEILQHEEAPPTQEVPSDDWATSAAPSTPYRPDSYEAHMANREIQFLARMLPFCDSNGCVSLDAPYTLLTDSSGVNRLERFGIATIRDFLNKFPTALHLAGKLSIAFRRTEYVHENATMLGLGGHFPLIPDSLRKGGLPDCGDKKLTTLLSRISSNDLKHLLNGDTRVLYELQHICDQTDSYGYYKPDTRLTDLSKFYRYVKMLDSMKIYTLGDFISANQNDIPSASLRSLWIKFQRMI